MYVLLVSFGSSYSQGLPYKISHVSTQLLFNYRALTDTPGNFVNAAIWTATESSLSVVSACIPSLRPLVTLIVRGHHQWPSMDSASTAVPSKTVWRTSKNDDPDRNFIRLEESLPDSKRAWGHNVSVHGGRISRGDNDNLDEAEVPPPEGIKVKTEVILISTDRLDYHDRLY